MQRHLPRVVPVIALAVVAAACGGSVVAVESAMAARVAPIVVELIEPPESSSTTTPLPVVTEEPVVSTTTTVAPASERPQSAGGRGGRAAAGRLASDGTPTFDGDFADPYLLPQDGDIYAYATNTMFMNVPVLVSYGDGGGELVGDALPELPAWSEPHHVWAPSITAVDDTYVLHYTTRHTASGRQCISVAVADHPAGPYVDDSTEPLVCTLDLGGSIDPSTFVDTDGTIWLLWKSDGNCCGIPTIIFAQPLTADGTELAGGAVELIRNDLSWERDVVEGPSMIEVDG
ncbi:MAG: glycoside hydrolase family 43 protein, partial [Actinomycetota bacterium]